MEEKSLALSSESIPIDAPEPEICLKGVANGAGTDVPGFESQPPEFPVRRRERVLGLHNRRKVIRIESRDPITGQAIHNLLVLV